MYSSADRTALRWLELICGVTGAGASAGATSAVVGVGVDVRYVLEGGTPAVLRGVVAAGAVVVLDATVVVDAVEASADTVTVSVITGDEPVSSAEQPTTRKKRAGTAVRARTLMPG
ncbi:hypothetical protein [Rhodococcus sp. 105337]|uniref:hypothetical protein n=1 Tax=Rhodococcus sp. 105337 TaxID=2725310 RepID=UPI001F10D85C|nr:hypothetical protein [Rhodococcus sp. 105337]